MRIPAILLLLASPPAHAFPDVSAQIQTDMTWHFNLSSRNEGSQVLAQDLIARDLGFSSRWRVAVTLMNRGNRKLELLLGPYVRLPVLFSFTHYGTTFSNIRTYEIGGDVGVDWLGYARLLFTFAPSWALSYETHDLTPLRPELDSRITMEHWSAGLRLEVPILTLESEPGDRRVEFGATLSYTLDRIREMSFEPIDFTPIPGDSELLNQSFRNEQETSYRWLLGVFMNFRI